jgi:hypothetical protein
MKLPPERPADVWIVLYCLYLAVFAALSAYLIFFS